MVRRRGRDLRRRLTPARTTRTPALRRYGATTVPAGQTVALKLTLTSTGRKLLGRKHSLKVTETIVAKNSAGQTQTTTRTVTIRLKRK